MKGDFWSCVTRVLPALKASLTCSNWEWIPTYTIRCAIVLHDNSIIDNELSVHVTNWNSLVWALHSNTVFKVWHLELILLDILYTNLAKINVCTCTWSTKLKCLASVPQNFSSNIIIFLYFVPNLLKEL